MRRPNRSPVIDHILALIPQLPNMTTAARIREQLMQHPVYKHSMATDQAGLQARLSALIRRERICRVAFGWYARPRNRADLAIKWRPVKHSKPTMSQELRTANAMLREQIGAEPKKRNEKRNLFAPPMVEKPQENATIDIFA